MGEIGDYAFLNCLNLSSITISGSVRRIGSNAFKGCTSLASVTIPDGVENIGGYAFSKCSNLSSMTINLNEEIEIDAYALANTDNLDSIKLRISLPVSGMKRIWTNVIGLSETQSLDEYI